MFRGFRGFRGKRFLEEKGGWVPRFRGKEFFMRGGGVPRIPWRCSLTRYFLRAALLANASENRKPTSRSLSSQRPRDNFSSNAALAGSTS